MQSEAIHVAYAISHKGGTTYRAVAVVKRTGDKCHHTHRVCLDDTAEAAVEGAIRYVRETYRRDGLIPPLAVIRHGKKHGALVDSALFASEARSS